MSSLFGTHNHITETFEFQVSGITTFDPAVTLLNSGVANWDFGDGSGFGLAGSSVSYAYTDGSIKTVKLKTIDTDNLNELNLENDNVYGHLDLTKWINLGGDFRVSSNPNLTRITHTPSSQTFSNYRVNACGLNGRLDLSGFPNLGGQVWLHNNNLTGVTHTPSTQNITGYYLLNNDITGAVNLSIFPNLGNIIRLDGNPNITSVVLPQSTRTYSSLDFFVNDCNLTTLDWSGLSGTTGNIRFRVSNNSNLTSITNPTNATCTFTNYYAEGCDLGYIDFTVVPNMTSIAFFDMKLENNNMTAAEVNQILVELDSISVGGFGSRQIVINGTNAAPDAVSGGYDGLAAKSSLQTKFGGPSTVQTN